MARPDVRAAIIEGSYGAETAVFGGVFFFGGVLGRGLATASHGRLYS